MIITWASYTPKGSTLSHLMLPLSQGEGTLHTLEGVVWDSREKDHQEGPSSQVLSASSSLPVVLVGPLPLPQAWYPLSSLSSGITST